MSALLLIACRGLPQKVISDNEKRFVAAAKWLRKITQNERFNDFLAQHEVIWQFNLSTAPWWGGMFERLVGLVKDGSLESHTRSKADAQRTAESYYTKQSPTLLL